MREGRGGDVRGPVEDTVQGVEPEARTVSPAAPQPRTSTQSWRRVPGPSRPQRTGPGEADTSQAPKGPPFVMPAARITAVQAY